MPNIPGAAVMTDTLDFVKNLWGSMGVVPGIAAPTLSIDELDKKINDLKAVEAWLNLNSSMVRGSIQALEVQRNTIATLKSMGKSLASAVQQPGDKDTKSLFETIPYASAFFQHAAEALQPAAPGPVPKEQQANGNKAEASATPAAPEPAPQPEAPAAAPTQAPAGANDAMAAAGLANPSVWWNLLQEQFKQAVTGAMSAEAMTGAAARATEAATKFAQAATQAATKPISKAAAAAQAATASAPVADKDEAEAARKPARKPAAKKAAKPAEK
jgi:hypothetical protein